MDVVPLKDVPEQPRFMQVFFQRLRYVGFCLCATLVLCLDLKHPKKFESHFFLPIGLAGSTFVIATFLLLAIYYKAEQDPAAGSHQFIIQFSTVVMYVGSVCSLTTMFTYQFLHPHSHNLVIVTILFVAGVILVLFGLYTMIASGTLPAIVHYTFGGNCVDDDVANPNAEDVLNPNN